MVPLLGDRDGEQRGTAIGRAGIAEIGVVLERDGLRHDQLAIDGYSVVVLQLEIGGREVQRTRQLQYVGGAVVLRKGCRGAVAAVLVEEDAGIGSARGSTEVHRHEIRGSDVEAAARRD